MQVVWVSGSGEEREKERREAELCKECGRQMVERPRYKRMREEDLKMAVKMRDEGMSDKDTSSKKTLKTR